MTSSPSRYLKLGSDLTFKLRRRVDAPDLVQHFRETRILEQSDGFVTPSIIVEERPQEHSLFILLYPFHSPYVIFILDYLSGKIRETGE